MTLSNVKAILNKYVSDVEHTIQDTLSDAPPFLRGMVGYHFGWLDQEFKSANYERGKFLRPTLCLLTFEALNGSHPAALPAAACLELIHNFSLIHDDIEDDDKERHSRPTAWTIWGKPLAINVGDFLYTLAYRCLYQLSREQFAPETIFAVQQQLNDACLQLTIGQDMDLRFEQFQDVTTDMYFEMVRGKTGALLEASILSGAILGTTDQTVIGYYREFARHIGVAFQVRDDILGIWGDSAETGKSVDNDLRRKKKTLPVIYTLNRSQGQRYSRLQQLYADPRPMTGEQIAFTRECLQAVDALCYAQDIAKEHIEKSFAALNKIGLDNSCQGELETIARFLVSRSH